MNSMVKSGGMKQLKFGVAASCISGRCVGVNLIHLDKLVDLGLEFCM